jgi:hypothetical protein
MGIFRLKRKTFGVIGWATGMNNFSKAANAMSSTAKGAGMVAAKQAAIGTAKLGAIGATVYGGKQVFDKMTGEG